MSAKHKHKSKARSHAAFVAGGREAGATLVEVMLAAGMMCTALVLTMSSFISVSATSAQTEDQMVATAALSSTLEDMRAMDFEGLMAWQPTAPAGLGSAAMVTAVCFDTGGTSHSFPVYTDSLSTPLDNPLEVQVTVTWIDKSGRAQVMRASGMYGR